MTKRPYLIGGLLLMLGYYWSWITATEITIPEEVITFHRREQMERLKALITNRLRIDRANGLGS
jgi:hypothetical protein